MGQCDGDVEKICFYIHDPPNHHAALTLLLFELYKFPAGHLVFFLCNYLEFEFYHGILSRKFPESLL